MPALSARLVNSLVVAAVILGFLTVIGVGLGAVRTLQRNIAFTERVEHTYQVVRALSDYGLINERIETARRGYLLAGDPQFLDTFRAAAAATGPAIDEIARLTRDNPEQQARVAELRTLSREQLAVAEDSIRRSRAGESYRTPAFNTERGVALVRQIRGITQAMETAESNLLAARNAERLGSLDELYRISAAAAVLLLVVAVGSTWIILRFTRDLTASRAELQAVNAGLEDAVKARTADLQRANDEIQRFAYIVSHDLRSPLVNVMGFTAELDAAIKPLSTLLEKAETEAPQIVTQDARMAVRDDLPESVRFIRTSTQKMDRLINAILQLSRQGRRVLTPEPLDMQRLFEGIAGSLKHRLDESGATVEIAPNLPNVVSDRLALEQIFSNLVENALKYGRPGVAARVQIRGRREGRRVIYEVVDNGRGVDPKDHERIFELFRRAGQQDQPGEGIGLAHVRALGYRLGGTVTCQSALDQGATFRVSLPAELGGEGSAA
ncbi:CHASE3 domain-containing protein [Phenylobacterium sp. J367]|uniref:sensor histidine kinase n=1 Tax=Phenylobacterium sp. J367 TaxID=2898435 RepID=UPI002150F43F|nr:sensor histidine kinase [Phenylobacterium sp. J367]MCR5878550.1 CHASE3 domain-containing protein [Phenylobacterium sp. J367]